MGQSTFLKGAGLFYLAVILAGIGGWIANIIKLVAMDTDHLSGMLVARAIGIFVAPLGSVLGFV